MATTYSYAGESRIEYELRAAFAGDSEGGRVARIAHRTLWSAAGGSVPTISGWLKGTFTAAAGDLLLAHATDPLQGMGDSIYSDGFTVAGSKLKALYIRNGDAAQSMTILRGALLGLPIFVNPSDGITIQPGGRVWLEFPTGTDALASGGNDKLEVTVSGAHTAASDILAIYGP